MMADSKQHVKTTSHKRGSDKKRHFPHLKPLSIYSHMVLSKATSSDNLPCSPGGPTWNIKVELSNSRAPVGQKRRLDDSCLDETYDTPLKKPCLDKHPSSGSGFVLDSSDTVRQVKFVSSQSSSVAIEEIERIEKTLSDQKALGLEWINSSDETDGQSRVSLPDVHSNSPVITSIKDNADVIVFDYDVDGIMCLSPIDNADVSADGLEDFIQICQPSYEELLPVEKNAECSHTQNASDEGYFTKSYSKVTMESELTKNEEMYFIKSYKTTFGNLSNEKTPPVSIPVMSTPVSKFRDLVKRSPLLSLKLDEGSWLCEPEKGSADCSSSPHLNIDAGNTEELPVLNVNKSKEGQVVPKGTSIHKLILCHSPEKHTATQVEKDEDVLSVSQLQTDSPKEEMFAEETDDADSFNSTLPLRVQVCNTHTHTNKSLTWCPTCLVRDVWDHDKGMKIGLLDSF